jgi:hypothetical protein
MMSAGASSVLRLRTCVHLCDWWQLCVGDGVSVCGWVLFTCMLPVVDRTEPNKKEVKLGCFAVCFLARVRRLLAFIFERLEYCAVKIENNGAAIVWKLYFSKK